MNEAFEAYFETTFGARWQSALRPALCAPAEKVPLENPFGESSYLIDLASLEPVLALDLHPGMEYLDTCAAPGGKALAAIYAVRGELSARLNDSSRDRLQRLKAVLYDYCPAEIVEKMRITCSDGARIGGREPETFDRVLADVPCSAERHHLQSGKKMEWSQGTSKGLSVRQHAILCSALDACKPGGRVVYSTCSLSPLENDGVIEKLLKSRKGQFEVLRNVRELGEATTHGKIILPDRYPGFGPIYYSVLQKR
jgi:16S rRNA C967 or C1407 C5-methylase (RsmB/RsmF family)